MWHPFLCTECLVLSECYTKAILLLPFCCQCLLWGLWFCPWRKWGGFGAISENQQRAKAMEWSTLLHFVAKSVCQCKLWYILWIAEQRFSREQSQTSTEDWNPPQLPLPNWLVPQGPLSLQWCDWSDLESIYKDQDHVIIWEKNPSLSSVLPNCSSLNFIKHLQHE